MGAVSGSGDGAATAVAAGNGHAAELSPTPAPEALVERRKHVGKVDLVLAGGGVKGIAHVGAVKALHDAGYDDHPRIAGTSVGAIIGALLAHGYAPCKIWDQFYGDALHRVPDARQISIPGITWATGQLGHPVRLKATGPLGALYGLRQDLGARPGLEVTAWLEGIFVDAGITTFGDLRHRKRRAKDSPPLVIMATDLVLGRLVQFPRDFADIYGLDPDEQPIFDAVRASMSIPLYFDPYAIEPVGERAPGKRDLAKSRFVDGGVLANFAVDVLDRQDPETGLPKPPRWPTFGITLLRDESAVAIGRSLRNGIANFGDFADTLLGRGLSDFADALVGTLVVGQDTAASEHWWMARRTIEIDTKPYEIVEFSIDKPGQRALFDRGYDAAQAFLADTWTLTDAGSPYGPEHGHDGRAAFPLPTPSRRTDTCRGVNR